MSSRLRIRSWVGAATALLVAASAQAIDASPAAAATDITVGVLPLTIAGPAQYGLGNRVFQKNGLHPTLSIYPSGPTQLRP